MWLIYFACAGSPSAPPPTRADIERSIDEQFSQLPPDALQYSKSKPIQQMKESLTNAALELQDAKLDTGEDPDAPRMKRLLSPATADKEAEATAETELHLAATEGDLQYMRALLADPQSDVRGYVEGERYIDAVGLFHETALHQAARQPRPHPRPFSLPFSTRTTAPPHPISPTSRPPYSCRSSAPLARLRPICGAHSVHQAVTHGQTAAVALLIEEGADLEVGAFSTGMRALHMASQLDQPEIASLLLRAGAALEARASYAGADPEEGEGVTPLGFASVGGSTATAEVLLAAGANVDGLRRDLSVHAASGGGRSWQAHVMRALR